MDKSKNLMQKINFNNEKNNNQQNLMYKNESQNEKEEVNEIIIELEISNDKKEKEIYILCDKNQLIKDNKRNKYYFKKIILIHRKHLTILIKIIQNYI